MHFDKPIVGYKDVEKIHEKYNVVKEFFPEFDDRKNYFLAACSYFCDDDNFNYDFARKLCPYGGLIGIDNSRLDKSLKRFKILRLHAILHDAGGFVYDTYNEGPGYSYMLPCKLNSCLNGHISGIMFCLYMKCFRPNIYHLLKC